MNFDGLKAKVVVRLETAKGYLQLLEYILQDKSFLHVLQWNDNSVLDEENLCPKVYNEVFFRDKAEALLRAQHVSIELLNVDIDIYNGY